MPGRRTTDPRKQRALATRRRMVQAAYRLFCDRGFTVPMTAIAAEAGVAVQTLYFTFHTKNALLQEAHDYAVLGDGETPPEQSRWFRALEQETDMRTVVGIMFSGAREILERMGPLVPVLQAASSDPEIAAFLAAREQLRVDQYRRMITAMARKGGLRQGMSEAEATDIALILCGPDFFRLATEGRGWTADQWQSRTAGMLADALTDRQPLTPGVGSVQAGL